jgi:hypothetical protein
MQTAALAAMLALTACSSGEADDHEPATLPPAVESTTTTAPATTTEATFPATTSTTEPLPPWEALELPQWPPAVLAEEMGGPAAIQTMCLEVGLTGFDTDNLRDLTTTIELLGIEVVESGCDVTLAVELDGSRTSARYTPQGGGAAVTCWGGAVAEGTVTLSADGDAIAEWDVDLTDPPPELMAGCPDRDSPLLSTMWGGPVAKALIDAFGTPAAIMAKVALPLEDTAKAAIRDRIDTADDAGGLLAAALAHPSQGVRDSAADQVTGWADRWIDEPPPYPEGLWSTIPHLIACDVRADGNAFDCRVTGALMRLLFRTVYNDDLPDGFDIHDPAAWWELWERDPEPPIG